jgi:hypothetical protein
MAFRTTECASRSSRTETIKPLLNGGSLEIRTCDPDTPASPISCGSCAGSLMSDLELLESQE